MSTHRFSTYPLLASHRSSISRLADDAPVPHHDDRASIMTPRHSIFEILDNSPIPAPTSWPARKPPFIREECPDCGAPTSATHVLGFACEHSRCPMFNAPSPARAAISAALATQARKTARTAIKARAGAYALRPRELDAIGEDLSSLPPKHLVTALAYIARNPMNRVRHFGFGGEVPAINLRAGMLYARWSRAIANRNARRPS
jgi:hypothetical protein